MRRNNVRVKRPRPFYIVVNPVGSKFAKALQGAIKEKVVNNVYRVSTARAVRFVRRALGMFHVTVQTLNKVQQFHRFKAAGVSCPEFFTSREQLRDLPEGTTVFARTLVNSTGGRGILEFDIGDRVPLAPLYTLYVKKKAEYRLHVFNGEVIDAQQKRKKREFNADSRDTRVRNLHNGYVYCRDNIILPDGIQELAIKAVNAVGYQYGAVDIIYNEKQNKCFVLEVNSRPGLMGTTLEKYRDAVIKFGFTGV